MLHFEALFVIGRLKGLDRRMFLRTAKKKFHLSLLHCPNLNCAPTLPRFEHSSPHWDSSVSQWASG